MVTPFRPLTPAMLATLGKLEGFLVPDWTGPALAAPAAQDGLQEVLSVAERLLSAGQALVQVKDALSMTYTLNGVTATAERFLLGKEPGIEAAAGIRALMIAVQSYLQNSKLIHDVEAHSASLERLINVAAGWLPHLFGKATDIGSVPVKKDSADDYSAFALEDMRQYAIGWTPMHDIFRQGYSQLGTLVGNVSDRKKATDELWSLLSRTALPYNLLVLRKLTASNVESFRTNFATVWTAEWQANLDAGTLYGIDMTIFHGFGPRQMTNGTVRFTPCTMTLLTMGSDKKLHPIAIYVADPLHTNSAEIYFPSSAAWLYGLTAVRASLTVYGIWLGHVFPLHIVTGAMLMTMQGSLPKDHVLLQLIGPHSRSVMGFNFLLLIGWDQLAPPTSIANSGQFLGLSAKYAEEHDFFSNDPLVALSELGLQECAFSDGSGPWNLYPNAALMLRLWSMVSDYIQVVVDDLYPTDADVTADQDLAAWMEAASASDGGNVTGLPNIQNKEILTRMLTSLLYRIIFHGIGRLKSISNPGPSFIPNFPPCLQSSRIPQPGESITAATLIREFLPRTGTIGRAISFYNLFSFTPPAVPLVPSTGANGDLFFASRYARSNESLVRFRRRIEALVAELQPDWVEIGQWPMSIEF